MFNESNGYLSVWHMSGPVKDVAGSLESNDVGTTAASGMVGQARHLAGGQGIFCGDKISNCPSGAGSHSSEAWFRAEKPNVRVSASASGLLAVEKASGPYVQICRSSERY